jgi:hypothetical protein
VRCQVGDRKAPEIPGVVLADDLGASPRHRKPGVIAGAWGRRA